MTECVDTVRTDTHTVPTDGPEADGIRGPVMQAMPAVDGALWDPESGTSIPRACAPDTVWPSPRAPNSTDTPAGREEIDG